MEKNFSITREKHLDHMVRVVPLIVFGYALQSYVILRVSPGEFSQVCLSIMGVLLAAMIGAFIYYDLKHTVCFFEGHLEITFAGRHTRISYEDIREIEIQDPGQSFSSLRLSTAKGKITFFFVDDAEKIQSFITERKAPLRSAA